MRILPVFLARVKPASHEREAGLHEVDEERSHERPTGVDGAEHNADTSPHDFAAGCQPGSAYTPAAAPLYLRSSAENPEKEALYFSLGRRGYTSPGNTKGAGGSFIRQRLCFRWQEYKAVWSKCQELNAIFDVLHKPEKNGQRKLWQASFFLCVAPPAFRHGAAGSSERAARKSPPAG